MCVRRRPDYVTCSRTFASLLATHMPDPVVLNRRVVCLGGLVYRVSPNVLTAGCSQSVDDIQIISHEHLRLPNNRAAAAPPTLRDFGQVRTTDFHVIYRSGNAPGAANGVETVAANAAPKQVLVPAWLCV
jgi:hypothetical protein